MSMARRCDGPVWSVDDITSCYRHRYFQEIPFALTGVASLTVLLIVVLPKLRLRHMSKDPAYRPLLASTSSDEDEDDHSIDTLTQDDVHDNNEYTQQTRSYGSVFNNQPELTDPTDISADTNSSSGTNGKVVLATVVRSTSERLRVALEAIAVAAQTALSLAAITVTAVNQEWVDAPTTPVVFLLFWVYCLVLVGVRLAHVNSLKVPAGGLWYHSTTLYAFAWVFLSVSFRSAIMHPFSNVSQNFYIAQWVLSVVLVCLNFSAKTGNKPAKIYVKDGLQPNNEPVASLFQQLSFSFIDPLVWLGYRKSLSMSDVWELKEEDHAVYILRKFRKIKQKSGMAMRMMRHFKKELAASLSYSLIYTFTIFGPAMLVKLILDYVENPVAPRSVAWMYAFTILICAVVDNVANGQSLRIGRSICIRMRAIIIGEVYAKALRRKAAANAPKDGKGLEKRDAPKDGEEKEETGQANMGSIINLMAIDAFKVSEICGYFHFLFAGVLQIILAMFLLYFVLDWSALVGAAILTAMIPANYKFAKAFGNFQTELMKVTDKRVEATNELLQSIRIVKFFGWEKKFAEGVLKLREDELGVLKKRYVLWAIGALMWFGTPLLVTVVSFAFYTMVQGKQLTSPTAFTAMTLFNIIRVPLDQICDMVVNTLQAKVSIDRIDAYLAEDETDKYNQLGKHNVRGPNSPYIGFEDASFSWNAKSKDENSYNFKLHDLNVNIPTGQMTVIAGPTGSGKTSLLMALLGEMDLEHGKVFLPGACSRDDIKQDSTGLCESVAYCSQQPWLLNDTLRNNILFASEFDQERYDRVIEACQLKRDLEILEAGDETEVGDKGIVLSGGQKQRISLARAMYSRSKHLILDDCLSAVDSHTSLAIYETCLTGEVAQHRTIILVSHNVALTIQQAAHVIVMDNGRVKAQGTPGAVVATGALGQDELVKKSASQSASESATRVSSTTNLLNLDKKKSKSLGREVAKRLADDMESRAISPPNDSETEEGSAADTAAAAPKPPAPKLVQEETMSTGFVDPQVYKDYMSAMGSKWFWGFLVVMFIAQQYFNILQSWWIREWTVKGMKEDSIGSMFYAFSTPSAKGISHISYAPSLLEEQPVFKHSTVYYLTIYFMIGLINMVLVTGKEMYVFYGGLAASRKLFQDLLNAMLHAKIRFFDQTPIGRIMNRFSKDVEGVDQDLAAVFSGFSHCLLTCLSTVALITWVIPSYFFFALFIFAMYGAIALFYLASSRELKRLDSVSKSPIYAHFSESLNGVATIRAYGDQRRFIRDNLQKIDTNNRPFYYLWLTNRWLSFRVDAAGALVSFGAAAFVLMNLDKIDSGLAGLILSYALVFNDTALWTVRLYAMVEVNLNSTERVLEYTNVESEAPHVIEANEPQRSNRIAQGWPMRGEIDFDRLNFKYAPELPLVIKNVSFKVESFNKVGIVGRTGAGKSSLINCLLRLQELESGSISIDGVEISTLGLLELRQALAIIPQDPTLFTGTIRSNLDPFEQYSSEQIFESLRRVHLIKSGSSCGTQSSNGTTGSGENENQFMNLDSKVTEGGSNLSQGQRQLMCLARSLLKSPKVLLLDEATASIDYETDANIQKTIRKELHQTTLLTIAHRLRSIIDYDKILVLDHGEVVEYEEPHLLLQNTDSSFYDMCSKSGELPALLQLAEQAYKKKYQS